MPTALPQLRLLLLLPLPPLQVALPHLLLLRSLVVSLHAAQRALQKLLVRPLALDGAAEPGRHALPCGNGRATAGSRIIEMKKNHLLQLL